MSNRTRLAVRAVLVIAGSSGLLLGWNAIRRGNAAPAPQPVAKENAAHDTVEPAAKTGDFSLTIYSTADPATFSPQDLLQDQNTAQTSGFVGYVPGYGVVREVRTMNLAKGTNRLEFSNVAAGIDPTTVAFRSLTAPQTTDVLEQNFEDDLTSPDKLLEKYIGREVVVTTKQTAGDKSASQTIRGKLLSANYIGYVLQTSDPNVPVVIQRADNIDSIRLSELKTGLVIKPTLNWKVEAEQAGEHKAQVTYQTEGLTWRADYNVTLSQDEKTADLSAWVTALNTSGMSYPDAKIKLVAGNVQRFVPERAQRFFNSGGGGGGGGGLFSAGSAKETGFKEKSFFEYHLYTLGRPTTLPNNSTKQIELFPAKDSVPVEKIYLYYGFKPEDQYWTAAEAVTDQTFGAAGNKTVDIYVKLRNSEANHLGIPLPAGKMRVYKMDAADSNREFIGEDIIQHTPKDENVMVRLGTAFDLVGERVQTEYKFDGPLARTAIESFSIKLRNHKTQAVRVIVKENMYRWSNWEITKSSEKWEKQDYRTIHIPVDVPAGGEKIITYTVKYSW